MDLIALTHGSLNFKATLKELDWNLGGGKALRSLKQEVAGTHLLYHSKDRCVVVFVELICYQRDKGRVAMSVTSSLVVPFGPNIWHRGAMLRVSSRCV